MSGSLAIPSNSGELYDAHDADIALTRPLMQGDIFEEVDIPGLEPGSRLAMVVMHPCSMRTGPTLRKRLTVIRVDKHQTLPFSKWPDSDYDFMPLPDLVYKGTNKPSLAACFRDIGSIKTADLDLQRRIATLSARGILYLQQRYIHSQTRVVVDLETLAAQMLPIFDEIELQEEWVDTALKVKGWVSNKIEAIQNFEKEFQDFLSTDDHNMRHGLKIPERRTSVRRSVRLEIKRRYLET